MGVNTLNYLLNRFDMKAYPRRARMPIEVPNFGRDCLAKIFAELGFTEGVEVGVKEGDYSEVLLKANPNLHLRSVDPWLVRPDYLDIQRPQKVFDDYEAKARATLGKYQGSEIVKDFSVSAAAQVPDGSLDFVYIDGHHAFLPVAQDLTAWTPKLRKGGILAGHDYVKYKPSPRGNDSFVVEVVTAWTDAHRIHPWFVLGRKEKREGEIRDRHRSFLWVV